MRKAYGVRVGVANFHAVTEVNPVNTVNPVNMTEVNPVNTSQVLVVNPVNPVNTTEVNPVNTSGKFGKSGKSCQHDRGKSGQHVR